MKKVFAVLLCLSTVLCFTACSTSGTGAGVTTSSETTAGETSLLSQSPTSTSKNTKKTSKTTTQKQTTPATKNSSTAAKTTPAKKTSSTATTTSTSVRSTSTKTIPTVSTTQSTPVEEVAYQDIACAEISYFQPAVLAIKNSNVLFHLVIPEEWELKESNNGYDIVKNAKTIGRITASATAYSPKESVNAFHGKITSGNVKVTHSIDRVNATSFTRTLCYNGDDNLNKYKKLIVTVNYEELDAAAVYRMMTEVQKTNSYTEKNMGVLPIEDNRNRILILGNSFVGTSNIGDILQKMCGYETITIEAHSRGGANVTTYAKDAYMLQDIQAGNYSVVFMCGLYGFEQVATLSNIVDACEFSDTKLAIFPAHNETRMQIDTAAEMYPNAVLIDWKKEIDSLIQSGIAESYFCIADSYKHSTPLAGYVGAHMIYRAIFNKIPTATYFTSVSKSQINLLGDYVTTGQATLFDESSAYLIP